MEDNKDLQNNTVSSQGQIKNKYVSFGGDADAGMRILFIGNSITRHELAPHIGWNLDCGMAASAIEKDYVHVTVAELKKRFGKARYCIAQLAVWERDYCNQELLETFFEARDFNADIVVVRIGENIHCKEQDGAALADAFEKMVRFLAPKDGCRIIFTELFWRSKTINAAIAEACNRIGGIPVALSDLGDDPTMKAIGQFEHKGVALHPSDKGMKHIAMRILEKC